jgi:heat shock protein HtpX
MPTPAPPERFTPPPWVVGLALLLALRPITAALAALREWISPAGIDAAAVALCVAGAGVVIWGLLPRPAPFDAPGPRLLPEAQPRLFEELRAVASTAGRKLPAEVYLAPQADLWVDSRGGFLGLGAQRRMGLGLPLLQVLTVSEMRGALAHALGVSRLLAARTRVENALREPPEDPLRKALALGARAFLRLTRAVALRQEQAADALACRVAGSAAFASGLRKTGGAVPAFRAYWDGEVVPLLRLGFLPPFAEGFRHFLSAKRIEAQVRLVIQALENAESDAQEVRPSLGERLAAASAAAAPAPRADDGRAASSLLDRLEALERRLLAGMVNPPWSEGLHPIRWEEVGERVLVPEWRAMAEENAPSLAGKRVEDVPDLWRAGFELPPRHAGAEEPVEARLEACREVLTTLVAMKLHERGFEILAPPGDTLHLRRGGEEVRPFETLREACEAGPSSGAWRARLAAWGIAGQALT